MKTFKSTIFLCLLVFSFLLFSCNGGKEKKEIDEKSSNTVKKEKQKRKVTCWMDEIYNEKEEITTNTYKIDSLEVSSTHLPTPVGVNWKDANQACEVLGDGWRLPTVKELELMAKNSEMLNFVIDIEYWSSELVVYPGTREQALHFKDEYQYKGKHHSVLTRSSGAIDIKTKDHVKLNVRVVRTII